jgi:putative ubiquitin-RnfH superfamily antitoxin RatB of RatAB toxin-antitoxin module
VARLRIEVVLALPGRQDVVTLELPEGATASQAAAASGLQHTGLRLGIGGKVVPPQAPLCNGDRVELLRPLATDPKEARRKRARRARPRH